MAQDLEEHPHVIGGGGAQHDGLSGDRSRARADHACSSLTLVAAVLRDAALGDDLAGSVMP
jgi:hypothetical protein